MSEDKHTLSRRNFLKSSGLAVVSGLSASSPALARNSDQGQLQVWSCGGLAEAFIPANQAFHKKTGVKIAYTGAFAAALGKSLLGDARTEIFAPRVVSLSKKLKDQGRMLWYKPLCFTRYVLAVPKGNPAGIKSIEDLAGKGIRVVLSFEASPPGGKATMILLKKAGLLEKVKKNIIFNGDCVLRSTTMLAEARADVSIVEQRITKNPRFAGKLEVIPIEEKYFPPPPMTFTIGLMKWAAKPAVATSFIDFILSSEGQNHFENAGFIPAISLEGRRLIERYGV
ncbi:MAG: substrate-binding domain-containing protein [Thermodesulfobacteriota bacterium]|nr:substrate-binding domain-containing protein [Thermodesulfobacteriota bacterium]